MLRYHFLHLRVGILTPWVLLAALGPSALRAEEMKHYAEATVRAYGEVVDSGEGGRSASASGLVSRDFMIREPVGSGGYREFASPRVNRASASVSDDPSRLLQVRSDNEGPGILNTYTTVAESPGPSDTTGMARWVGDRIALDPAPGQAPPDFLRLTFRVAVEREPLDTYLGGLLSMKVNDQAGYVSVGPFGPRDRTDLYLKAGESPLTIGFEPIPADATFDKSAVMFFRYDLPIGADGLSEPLTVTLAAVADENPGVKEPVGGGVMYRGRVPASTLSLSSIALPDGSTPESQGYAPRFESGLRSPNPVPEPASVVIWGFAGAVAFGLARRRRNRA